MKINVENRIVYLDMLKFIAILSVIALHVFQIWNNGQQILHFNFYALAEITRPCVPLFLMITGALLLNRDIELKSFFKKKIVRIICPFLFYLIIHLIVLSSNNFNLLTYNWYFWMILGVYVSIPIINNLVKVQLRELEYFVLMILVSLFIYQLLFIFKISNNIDLNFFIGPISYLILGYYFSIKEFNVNNNKLIAICLGVFILVTSLKIFAVSNMIPKEFILNYISYNSSLNSSWISMGFFEVIQTSSLFVLIKYIYCSNYGLSLSVKNFLNLNPIKKFVISVSQASYGMYLINRTLMLYCDINIKGIPLTGKQMVIWFIVLTGSIFLISWIIVLILSKIPFIKKFSGYA